MSETATQERVHCLLNIGMSDTPSPVDIDGPRDSDLS